MRLPVPGPRDVVRLVERGAEAVELLLSAAPRVNALLDEADRLLTKVDDLVERIEVTRASADGVVRRTDEVVSRAERLVTGTDPLVVRLGRLLDSMEPSLAALQPTLERLAETTDPKEVDALVTLVDHLPVVALKMENDVIPVLDSLSSVAPDLHDLLDASRQLNEMLAVLPGLGKAKKKVDEEQAENDEG